MKQVRMLMVRERYAANLLIYPHGEWYVIRPVNQLSTTNLYESKGWEI